MYSVLSRLFDTCTLGRGVENCSVDKICSSTSTVACASASCPEDLCNTLYPLARRMHLKGGVCLKASRRCVNRRHGDLTRCGAVRPGSDEKIENLRTVYCDDFKCDSSPQVERTIRSFAKNVELHTKWTITIFAENAEYTVWFP